MHASFFFCKHLTVIRHINSAQAGAAVLLSRQLQYVLALLLENRSTTYQTRK